MAELELRLQELLTQRQTNATSSTTTITPVSTQALPLKRANSNTNSLASNKSLDNAAGAAGTAAVLAEQASISSAASLKSPTLDCFGTVAYPAISATTADQWSAATEALKNLPIEGGGDQQQPCSSATGAYLQSQMTALVNTLQTTDARAAALQGDCLSLRAQLLALAAEKGHLESRLAAHHQVMGRIEEEYQTSVENYEAQLRTMSEHLAELNEKVKGRRFWLSFSNLVFIFSHPSTHSSPVSARRLTFCSTSNSSSSSNRAARVHPPPPRLPPLRRPM